jgi:hypothetical protein
MTAPTVVRKSHVFATRAEALGVFFERAGEAPRLLAFDEDVGCPLHNALVALEWGVAVGVLHDSDLIHAARLGGESAAVMVERKHDGKPAFVYMGPRIDAPPTYLQDGAVLYDQPGVRAIEFAQRAPALAHFLRTTGGVGSVVSLLSRRAPDLMHLKRWLSSLFQEPVPELSNVMIAGWFATSGGGCLFAPVEEGGPYHYEELGRE